MVLMRLPPPALVLPHLLGVLQHGAGGEADARLAARLGPHQRVQPQVRHPVVAPVGPVPAPVAGEEGALVDAGDGGLVSGGLCREVRGVAYEMMWRFMCSLRRYGFTLQPSIGHLKVLAGSTLSTAKLPPSSSAIIARAFRSRLTRGRVLGAERCCCCCACWSADVLCRALPIRARFLAEVGGIREAVGLSSWLESPEGDWWSKLMGLSGYAHWEVASDMRSNCVMIGGVVDIIG